MIIILISRQKQISDLLIAQKTLSLVVFLKFINISAGILLQVAPLNSQSEHTM